MNLPSSMQAMVLQKIRHPLQLQEVPIPSPLNNQVLIKVIACGVCRTDLHITDGDLANPKLPLIPGHEIVGRVVQKGDSVMNVSEGEVVGIPWLGYTCGTCKYCRNGKENLCEQALFTGYSIDGGYAEYTVANEKFCFALAHDYANESGSPLLCAGLIGYRSYTRIGDHVKNLGIYGFGAAAHILTQLAIFDGKKVFAFTRNGDEEAQSFALQMGAVWAGDSSSAPPVVLDAAIIFAPVGALVPIALRNVDKGGIVVCGGIHMSDIPSFPYHILWGERVVQSVANLTRDDGKQFLELAPQVPIRTSTTTYSLAQANKALDDLRNGRIKGAAVLLM